jgi:predicted transcriptional regulator
LVIADILEGLQVPRISTSPFSIPSWNAKSDKFMLVLFSFCMQYLHDDGVLLIFHPEDPKWTKEFFMYFFQL